MPIDERYAARLCTDPEIPQARRCVSASVRSCRAAAFASAAGSTRPVRYRTELCARTVATIPPMPTTTRTTRFAAARSRRCRRTELRPPAPPADGIESGAPGKHGCHPGGELARAERLDDVVVGAGVEPLLDV